MSGYNMSCPQLSGSNDTEPCGTEADGDLLGFGVRLGAYMQALGTIFSLLVDRDNATSDAWMQLFTAIPVLVLALVYSLKRIMSNALFLATCYLSFTQTVTMAPGLFLPSPLHHKLLSVLILGTYLCTSGVMLWYWAYGYSRCCDTLNDSPTKVWAFLFFFKVAAFGWFRVFSIVLYSIAFAIALAFTVGMYYLKKAHEETAALHPKSKKGKGLAPTLSVKQASEVAVAVEKLDSYKKRNAVIKFIMRHESKIYTKATTIFAAILMFLVLVYVIFGVEYTLKYNNVGDIYSLATGSTNASGTGTSTGVVNSGQLIAMVLGVGTLVKPIYFLIGSWRRRRKTRREASSEAGGRHTSSSDPIRARADSAQENFQP